MPEYSQKTIATLLLFALVISTCGLLFGVSSVGASGQSGDGTVGKGLGDARPMVIEARPDKGVRVNSGWKLFLVGTNEYDNLDEKYDLHYAVKDVESLKGRFIQLGVPEENITVLTSQRGKWRANKRNIQRYFNEFLGDLDSNDSAFVYLSGHGFQFKGDSHAYYAPTDIDPDDIRTTGVSIDEMQKQLEQSSAKLKWMTVDACRNDPGRDAKTTDRAFPTGVTSEFIVKPSNLPDAFVFMQGCGNGQCSLEARELEQGLLTYSLLEALQCDDNPADRDDSGQLEFVDLIRYVQKRTQELAYLCRDESNRPHEQKPRVTCSQLPNFTLLTNLRRGGLTKYQRQEIADFENYLANNDIGRAEDALEGIVGFFPEGENAQKFKELNEKFQKAKRQKVVDAELAQKRQKAEGFYANAQRELDSKAFVSAKIYIDRALALCSEPKYQSFLTDDLTVGVIAAVQQAISDRDYEKAQSLNELLMELDAPTAKANVARIAALSSTPHVSDSSAASPKPSDEPRSNSVTTPVAGTSGAVDSEREAGELMTLEIAGVEVNFRWAPAGEFVMGSPTDEVGRNNDEFQHKVTLSQGFWIAETETTQELWQAVMGNNPSGFKGSDQLPVENLSWNDCDKFILKLKRDRKCRAVLPEGYKYAIPTEAQWEYACRAGTTTPFNFGAELTGDKANCDGHVPYGTSTKGEWKMGTTPVKSYQANAWGVYDMHGNVAEWCADWYDSDYYTISFATHDPTGADRGYNRVIRGGSWSSSAVSCRSAERKNYNPDEQYYTRGIRLVLVPK